MKTENYKNNRGPHTKIIAWKEAVILDDIVRKLLSNIRYLDFKLKSQIINAVASIIANIVEGYYGRTTGDYIRFCRYSRRSCAELRERMILLLKQNNLNNSDFIEFDECAIRVGYLIDRLIAGLEKKQQNKK